MKQLAGVIAIAGFVSARPDPAVAQSKPDRFELGIQVSSAISSQFDRTDRGLGGRLSWHPIGLVGIESEINVYPGEFPDRPSFSRGRVEGLFGVTAGHRFAYVRPFARLRSGFLNVRAAPRPYACILIFPPPLSCELASGRTLAAFDIGGGVEVFATRAGHRQPPHEARRCVLQPRLPVCGRCRPAVLTTGTRRGKLRSGSMNLLRRRWLEDHMRTVATLTVVGLLIGGAAAHRLAAVSVAAGPASAIGQPTDREKERLLEAFSDAWNRHDVDALMSMMATDCVFEAAGGNVVDGERHEGQRAVRAAYAAVFEQYPNAHWGDARHFVAGDRGVSEWTFTGTLKDGRRVEVTGCDVFTFRNGKIAIKNSFRKNRPPIG